MNQYILAAAALVSAASTLADPEPSKPPAVPDTSATAKEPDSLCLKETGSHFPPKEGHCAVSPGRAYGNEAIEETGAASTAEALQKLDSSLTTRHR